MCRDVNFNSHTIHNAHKQKSKVKKSFHFLNQLQTEYSLIFSAL